MSSFFHRLVAFFSAAAVVLPAADSLPAGTPKAIKVGMAVVGVAAAIATNASKVAGKQPQP